MIEIIHNPRCSKSRQALELLKTSGIDFKIRLYLQDKLSSSEILEICEKLDITPSELLRKKESKVVDFLKGNDEKSISDEEALKIMINYPKTIERPIVINGDVAKIGRPPESVLEIL